jgi:hypothetical protein
MKIPLWMVVVSGGGVAAKGFFVVAVGGGGVIAIGRGVACGRGVAAGERVRVVLIVRGVSKKRAFRCVATTCDPSGRPRPVHPAPSTSRLPTMDRGFSQ